MFSNMVKLVRLTTDNNNAVFENTFNEDITIAPQSKIALKNFSCEISTVDFTINTANNKITYGTAGTALHDIFLDNGNYDKTNIDTLIADLENKLNSAMDITNSTDHSRQWKVEIIDNIFNIGTKYGFLNNIPSNDTSIISKNLGNVTTFRRGAGTVGTNDSFFSINKPLCKGAGLCRVTISSIGTDITQPSFIFGVVDYGINSGTVLVSDTSIYYGVKLEGGTYKILQGTSPIVNTNLAPLLNDTLTVEKSGNTLRIKRYNGVVEDVLGEIIINSQINLYPVGVLISSGTANASKIILNNFTLSADPYYSSFNADTADNLGNIPSPVGASGIYYLTFDDVLLANFLGFTNRSNNSISSKTSYTFTADKQFKPTDLSESYIIELLNIPLVSYNGAVKQRQNILNTIVNTQVLNDRIAFETNYPLYIDINNSQKITLRNIKARVLKEDGSPITITGFSQMTILIN